MRRTKVIELLEHNFSRCTICAAVVMKESMTMHKDWHKLLKKELK
jgi:hypothetical protein